jgi:hypothetical protein
MPLLVGVGGKGDAVIFDDALPPLLLSWDLFNPIPTPSPNPRPRTMTPTAMAIIRSLVRRERRFQNDPERRHLRCFGSSMADSIGSGGVGLSKGVNPVVNEISHGIATAFHSDG